MRRIPMIKRILHLLLTVFLLLLPCFAFADEPTPTTTDPAHGAAEFKAGEIIVKFKESTPKASVQSLLLAEKMEILDEMDQVGIMLLSVPEGRELEKIEELKRNPLVEYAEPNYVVHVANTIMAEPDSRPLPAVVSSSGNFPPDDPYLPWQWNLSKIDAFGAWEITTGGEKVVIAVIGTGVDLDHPELQDKIWTNRDEIPGNDIDDDGNGFVDDVHGWDFVNWNGEPQDHHWLGTYVASVAAGETNNETLTASVSWGAEIMPINVFEQEVPRAYVHYINGGILYAADNGAKIINVNAYLGTPFYSNAMQVVIDYAHAKGALIIAGSGDPTPDHPIPPDEYQYPAALNHVVSVAATDRQDEYPRDYSTTYNDKVDVAAPGVGIWGVCIYPDCEPAAPLVGTYAAAAQVSGLAALIWSVNPNLTPDQVEGIIESTAVDLGEPGKDDYFGWGRIDAAAAALKTTHHLEVEPHNVLDFGRVCDHGSPPLQKITNPNTNSSTWRVVPTDDWLSISGPEGLTPSWALVSIDKSHLQNYDVYTAGITAISIMTNYEHSPIIIPVTAVYTHCWTIYLPLLFKNYTPD